MAVTRQLQFYLDRAAQARADAESTTLDNVRERCLRAEDAWNRMAEKAARTEEMRVGRKN
jgi:hypothetical protein